jgi:hypothetical protein
MAEKRTTERARQDARKGKSPSTQAGNLFAKRCTTCAGEDMGPALLSKPLPSDCRGNP